LGLKSRGIGNKKLFIDEETLGTHARFINHRCDPNTEFIEMCHNREAQVVVKTLKKIEARTEITVDYGSTWFVHNCNTPKCRQVRDQADRTSAQSD
jgi:SET domain-containing protein